MPIIVILFSFNYNRNVKKDKVKITFYRKGNL